MPAAMIAVSMLIMLVVTTPSDASPSCMTETEARQHFGSVHIYWHGQDHCWDATPTRRQQKKPDQAKWRDAMSEILVDREEPVQTTVQKPWVDRWVDIGSSKLPLIARRWVDIAQVKSPPIIERKPKPMLPPHLMLLATMALAIALTLATIEFLFRRTIFE
jgi:hypothetical protein